MKKKKDFRILIIIALIIIFIFIVWLYFKEDNQTIDSNAYGMIGFNNKENYESTEKISTTTEVKSALTEKIELHATYYFSEIYVNTSDLILKDSAILKYTNDEEMLAPYDCIINEVSVPDTEAQCTNSHYIEISSNNILQVSINVSEEKINKIKLGQEATIEISACNKKFVGNITHISSTANKGKFTAIIEFENDGNVKIGMSADVELEV